MKNARVVFAVLGVALILGSAAAESNRWNIVTSPELKQAFVRMDCPGQARCQDDDFFASGDESIFTECTDRDFPSWGRCYVKAESYTPWRLRGFAGEQYSGGDTLPGQGTEVNIAGERISSALFEVEGYVHFPYLHPDADPVEVAVIRYAGDPLAFAGVEAESVYDLVDLGLIGNADVLNVQIIEDREDVFMQVDVIGLADEEIVVFAAGNGWIEPQYPAVAGMASDSFSYCFAHSETVVGDVWSNYLDACRDHDLQVGGSCSMQCPTLGAGSTTTGFLPWKVSASTYWYFYNGTGTGSITVQGVPQSSGSFLLNGTQEQSLPVVKPHVGVFRFAGDPTSFGGPGPFHVQDLVESGQIAAEDVLFSHDFGPGDPAEFSFEVDLGGTSPTEIVVLATARGGHGEDEAAPVPAITSSGIALLILALLGAGAWGIRRNAR